MSRCADAFVNGCEMDSDDVREMITFFRERIDSDAQVATAIGSLTPRPPRGPIAPANRWRPNHRQIDSPGTRVPAQKRSSPQALSFLSPYPENRRTWIWIIHNCMVEGAEGKTQRECGMWKSERGMEE
jgi:hypothetical protein